MIRTRGFFVLVSTALVGGLTVTGGSAGAEQEMSCTAEYSVTLSPGLGPEPVSDGVFHSAGETGTIDCGSGGTGTIGIDGRYATGGPATCTSGGEGWGVFSYTLGGKTIKDTFTSDFGGISGGYLSGKFVGERFSGTYTLTPTEGDCVTAPVTRADIRTDGTMKG